MKHPTMGQVTEVRGAKHTGGTTAFSFFCVCVCEPIEDRAVKRLHISWMKSNEVKSS